VGEPGSDVWKLHICAQGAMSSPDYFTLSYRWGNVPSLMLNQANIDELCRGKPIHELPLTFRDAVAVAHDFSVRYLWIDRLCILQDSREDWERESSSTRDVYANSALNISATVSTDPTDGLFREREEETFIRPGIVFTDLSTTPRRYCIYEESYWDRQVTNTVLQQRGWAFQERRLAPRILHFSEKQIFWECFLQECSEGFPCGIPGGRKLQRSKNLEAVLDPNFFWPSDDPELIRMHEMPKRHILTVAAFDCWCDIVDDYTARALTRPEDRLVALSGVANVFLETIGDVYLAGNWKTRLPMSLDWRARLPMSKLPSGYLAPSWSWACGIGPVEARPYTDCSEPLISIVDASVQTATPDPTGSVSGGSVILKGLLIPATLDGSGCQSRLVPVQPVEVNNDAQDTRCSPISPVPRPSLPSSPPSDAQPVPAIVREDFAGTDLGNGRVLYCLPLSNWSVSRDIDFMDDTSITVVTGIVLEPASSPHLPGAFVRLGHFSIETLEEIENFGIHLAIRNRSYRSDKGVRRTVITIV
jgi:Heterokaryon incompatibility protein (HET)